MISVLFCYVSYCLCSALLGNSQMCVCTPLLWRAADGFLCVFVLWRWTWAAGRRWWCTIRARKTPVSFPKTASSTSSWASWTAPSTGCLCWQVQTDPRDGNVLILLYTRRGWRFPNTLLLSAVIPLHLFSLSLISLMALSCLTVFFSV